ncbi:ABC transporter ATP-binding protein [Sedimentibacter hydroxybenzoicus DSM 7310]|uniref:ABC transporter ATP-binding protein n=1 Tax=Sedimentibacter hydroxybenzoicus DSM 7310 TaxID=1123245 RepID=A0A974BL24_SEDHY|nr:ABC transporter ATP-binding protein [Sedimentibacter hydroxybenzoicus]NYB75315.1 ABC transporter ATP-binding protein [Sedimentibacter hydroxybenzoicus DSM 7310]
MFISAESLCKSYGSGDGKNDVLKNVDISLEKGHIGVILGPSGSGKSTLMNMIGGVDRVDSGSIIVDNDNVAGFDDDALTEYRRKNVGFIFQFYNLVPNLTVSENIEVCANISDSPLRLNEILSIVGLEDKKNRFPRELSGGEQQRVAVARAIVKNPKLLLCDEPTGALDFETSRDVLSLLQKINREFGTTILMITHNIAIGDMAHVVYKLRSGEITEVIRNDEIIPAERIEW